MNLSDSEVKALRLQVFIARSGVCSRRKAFELIEQGSVKVNGVVVTEPSTPVNPQRDSVKVANKLIRMTESYYILLHKPKGYVTTKEDPHAVRTVFDLIPKQYRSVSPVGRLDADTEGLLLLTNDGDLAFKLTHPKFGLDKVYFVRTAGYMSDEGREKLEKGIFIDGERTSPAKVKILKASRKVTEFFITIHEGKKRQIRRMASKIGHKVLYLKRIEQGPLKLGDLPLGQWRLLTKKEINLLKQV